MIRTLTTEQLRARAESLGLGFFIERRAWIWVKEWFDNGCTSATAEEVMMWSMLANREAQPVAVTDEMALAFHRALNDGGIGEADLEEIKVGLRGALCNITAPPASAYPERLPCPVHLLPGLKFGKGVPTRSMLDALVRRAEYESELDAMTPEQMAENDTRLEKLKALIPPPTPANAAAWEMRYWNDGYNMWHDWERITAEQHAELSAEHAADNDYEFRVLYDAPAAPAVPEQATPENIELLASGYHGTFHLDTEDCVIAADIWNACRAAMLAAAPESGNDHDTRR
ncbi:hypothetical protein [Serratia marcescens]|uniref:hypothetical protein n=1 Tax=Serratia marcescens TaxID=615 RepID=UPI000A18A969